MVLEEKTYVDKAEQAIKRLSQKKDKKGKPIPMVTITKIRNLLAMTADIYNEVLGKGEELSEEINGRIDYLRVRFLYEAGRESGVRDFVEEAEILKALEQSKGSRKRYILFQHYMEALVAFHKFNKGRD